MEALRVDRMKEVLAGIELGKKQLRAVMNTINSNIEMGTVINAGPFLYMLLKGKIRNILRVPSSAHIRFWDLWFLVKTQTVLEYELIF